MDTDRTLLPLAESRADSASCACCSTGSAESGRRSALQGADTSTLRVLGMTCAHCVASVTEELGELDGVDAVDIALVAGGESTVTVALSGPVREEALRTAVEAAGYQVVSR
ncbi:MAG: copP [Naasia sp.]|nr:copP [Naasia sp.]